MKDEWNDWKQAWDAGARSLPEIQAQSEKQRRNVLRGAIGASAIGACLVVGSIWAAVHSPSWVNTTNLVFQCTVVSAMLTMLFTSMWGNWREPLEATPDALLGLMERRWTARRRGASFVRWGGLFICAFVEIFCLVVDVTTPAAPWWMNVANTAFTVGMAIFFWIVSGKQFAKIDVALGELAEQRRLLRESDPGADQLA
jgi:hypothetical protein